MKTGAFFGVMSVVLLLMVGGLPMKVRADPDYIISGSVKLVDGQNELAIVDYEVTLTYVPTRETLQTSTDESGGYEFNLADLTLGYSNSEWVEVTAEPYPYQGGEIPTSDVIIQVDTSSSTSPSGNIEFNVLNNQPVLFILDISISASNLQTNGFSIWNMVQTPAYFAPNPVNLFMGCFISGTNNDARQLTITTSWSFQVQNSLTNSIANSNNPPLVVGGKPPGGNGVPYSWSLLLKVPTSFTPSQCQLFDPTWGDATTLTATLSGTYSYGPLGPNWPLNFGPFSCTIYLWPQQQPPNNGIEWNPPTHPPFNQAMG